jgi:hypothetical protein
LSVQAEDAAANASVTGTIPVHVDNTAPGAVPVVLQGGEHWRNQNDFDLSWTNPDEGDRAPITAVHYRLCPASGAACITEVRAGQAIQQLSDVPVPSAGEWHLHLWREDGATNQEPANASIPVALRYDPEPPQLGFEDSPASDPTLVSVLVTDEVSGLGGGQIEISREGSGVWEVLPTGQDGSRLTARVDDARLLPGPYVLRATARDQAMNQNTTDRRLDGRPMSINLPIRLPTVVRAGVVAKKTARGKKRRREATVLLRAARVPFGHRVEIAGRVQTGAGIPIRSAQVQILRRSGADSVEQVVATLRTDRRGRYAYVAQATATSVLRVVYSGTATNLPSQRGVTLLVPAASTIRARPRQVLNGQAVSFLGRLRSRPVPTAGKLVELQVVLSGRWQTFRTVRTDASGAWRARYRFRRSCGVLRYRFRARLPAESGYPFEAGHTRGVKVLVRGEPCR